MSAAATGSGASDRATGQRRRKRQPRRTLGNNVVVREAAGRWHRMGDAYHAIIALSWPRFFALLAGFFLGVNLLFASAYWLVDGSVEHSHAGSFLYDVFFSIETLATVGYGDMVPGSVAGHLISSLETLIGLMSLAVIAGLVFARFAKPTARVLFSDKAVVRSFNGQRVLMLRVANERYNRMVEPTANLGLVRLERTAEGEAFYRLHDLALARSRNLVFALTWTLIHPIDEQSPLYGWDQAALAAARTRITISITGHDENIAADVHALHEYSAEDLFFDHRFVDIIDDGPDGTRVIDLTRFHDIVPVGPPPQPSRRRAS